MHTAALNAVEVLHLGIRQARSKPFEDVSTLFCDNRLVFSVDVQSGVIKCIQLGVRQAHLKPFEVVSAHSSGNTDFLSCQLAKLCCD